MAGNSLKHGHDMKYQSPFDDGLQVAPPTTEKLSYLPESEDLQFNPHQENNFNSKPDMAYDGKQVHNGVDNQPGLEPYRRAEASQGKIQPKRRRLCLGLIAGAIALVLIIVAVVVAVVVARNHSNNSTTTPPNTSPTTSPTSSPTTSPTTGAFNQTALVAIDPRTAHDAVWLFSQSYAGDIQLSRLPSDGTWQNPQTLGLENVANGTSIEVVSYVTANRIFYHLFYINSTGYIQDSIMTNETNQWEPGNIGTMGWKASTMPISVLKSWWNFNTFGKTYGVGGGIRLYAGGTDGILHEYSYDQATSSWAAGYIFEGVNGAGGIGITQNGNSTLLHLVNSNNAIELWWWNELATNAYPTGAWVKGDNSSASVLPNSAVTLDGSPYVLYFQDPQNNINSMMSTGFENSERWEAPNIITGISAIQGTRLSSFTYNTTAGDAPEVHLYCQSNNSNIVEFVLNSNTGPATNILYLPLTYIMGGVILAFPMLRDSKPRRMQQDWFRGIHRIAACRSVLLYWVLSVVTMKSIRDRFGVSCGNILAISPSFGVLFIISCLVIHPWPNFKQGHAAKLVFNHCTAGSYQSPYAYLLPLHKNVTPSSLNPDITPNDSNTGDFAKRFDDTSNNNARFLAIKDMLMQCAIAKLACESAR